MIWASLGLAALALLLVFGGFLFSVVPVVGTLLSFLAPVAALAGIVTGGVGLSRARQDGDDGSLPVVAIVLNAVMLVPGLLVALTCGVCNACLSAGMMSPQQGSGFSFDAGVIIPSPPAVAPDGEGSHLLANVIKMATDLNLQPIAEGVSHADQADFLASHGCNEMQGFHFSAAMPAEAFREKLRLP